MVIGFLESRTAAWGFGEDPQILWGVGVDHPLVIRCRTFAIGRVRFGGCVRTSPFLSISILAVSGIIHLVSFSTDGAAMGICVKFSSLVVLSGIKTFAVPKRVGHLVKGGRIMSRVIDGFVHTDFVELSGLCQNWR